MPAWPTWLLLCFGVALAITAWARGYALRRNLLDQPGERRSHASATPRGGGISIVVVLLLASLWLGGWFPGQRAWFGLFGAGLALVAGIGWVDDHRPLSPWLRLSIHVLAASLLAAGFWHDGAGPWVAMAAFLLAVGLTNVWNFMDGIDGLAASQAGIVAIWLGIMLPSPWNWLAVATLGAIVGFLPFNFPKARIFLGDVGSGALGFALAALLAAGLGKGNPSVAWLPWMLPVAAFVVDTAFTLIWRILNGERWWTPHVQHAYQRWARRIGHGWVTGLFALFTAGTIGICLVDRGTQPPFVILVFIICYTLAGCLWWSSRRLRD